MMLMVVSGVGLLGCGGSDSSGKTLVPLACDTCKKDSDCEAGKCFSGVCSVADGPFLVTLKKLHECGNSDDCGCGATCQQASHLDGATASLCKHPCDSVLDCPGDWVCKAQGWFEGAPLWCEPP